MNSCEFYEYSESDHDEDGCMFCDCAAAGGLADEDDPPDFEKEDARY